MIVPHVASSQKLVVHSPLQLTGVRGSFPLHMHWCLVPFVMLSDTHLASSSHFRRVHHTPYFISPARLPWKSKRISNDLDTLVPAPSCDGSERQWVI